MIKFFKKAPLLLIMFGLIGSAYIPLGKFTHAQSILETNTEEVSKEMNSSESQIENLEIIVKFEDKAVDLEKKSGEEKTENFAKDEELEIIESLPEQNIAVVVPEDAGEESIRETIKEIEDNPLVEYAEPNFKRNIFTINKNDTYKHLQWALENTAQTVDDISGLNDADIDAPEAWNIATTTSEIIVAVIDTGVDYTHTDLSDVLWNGDNCVDENGNSIPGGCIHGYDFDEEDNNPMPTHYHGTHVAGIIAAEGDNDVGIIGVAPNARIMALRFGLDVVSEVRAIDFAIKNGAKIINASYGGTGFSQAEYDAIERFRAAGGIFIAAAGNSDSNNEITHHYPSDHVLDNIIAVAATDLNDNLASFSNYGNVSIDIGAPGVKILSTYPDEQYAFANGTSMAAPQVAAAAALIWGYKPSLTRNEVREIILNNSDALVSLSGKTVTGKRLNVFKVLDSLVEGENDEQVTSAPQQPAPVLSKKEQKKLERERKRIEKAAAKEKKRQEALERKRQRQLEKQQRQQNRRR